MLPLHCPYPYRKPRWAEVGQTYIHIRRNCTLWFWQCKNFANSQLLVKNKATGTPHEVYYRWSSLASDDSAFDVMSVCHIIYTDVGLSTLLVSTGRAMRRPLHCGTSDSTGSTSFLCTIKKCHSDARWRKVYNIYASKCVYGIFRSPHTASQNEEKV